MRILLVAPWDEDVGGVVYVVSNLAQHLHRQGHDVISLYPGSGIAIKPKATKNGLPGFNLRLQLPFSERHFVLSTVAFPILFPITLLQLLRFLKKQRIQLINVHYPTDGFFYFAICSRILRIRLVNSVHGADLFPDGHRRKRYSRALTFLLSSSDVIVAPSRGYQNAVSSLFPELRDKTFFIHNGVQLAEFNCERNNTSETRSAYILCIAMHTVKKGLDVLLRAFEQLQRIRPPLKLILVGDGPLRGQLESLASVLGIKDKVEFLGRQGRTEVARLLHGCEVFVLPSRSEPFGIVLIEAMACKKPVVATKVGGIPEIIENGTNGLLVEPDNPDSLARALLAVVSNQTLRDSLARQGYDTVQKHFRTDKMGASYEAIFDQLIRSSQGSTSLPTYFQNTEA